MMDREPIVLAFSGGPHAAAAARALTAQRRAVVTLTLDVGQGRELTGVRERALACGAIRAHVIDVRDTFAAEYLWPAVQAGLRAECHTAELIAPLVARSLVDVARIERSSSVAHEWSGADADRLERIVAALAPGMAVLAPASQAGVTVDGEPTLWSSAPVDPEIGFALTREPGVSPRESAAVDVAFVRGVPVRVNGVDLSLVEAIESLETIAGAHGVGRVPLHGGWVEAPAAVVLETAYAAVERTLLDARVLRLKRGLAEALAAIAHDARWGSAEHDAIAAFTASLQARLDATVRLRLHRGECLVVSCVADAPRAAAAGLGVH